MMHNAPVIRMLQPLLDTTDTKLWNSYRASTSGAYETTAGRLIFPTRTSDKGERVPKINEQLARFMFAHTVAQTNLLYSVETPTRFKYIQTGQDEDTANVDLTLYQPDGQHACNVEFKYGTIGPKAKDALPFRKDLEKLWREPGPGLWFHLLGSANNGTIRSVLATVARELHKIMNTWPHLGPKALLFHLCVLRQGYSLQKSFDFDRAMGLEDVNGMFGVCYRTSRERLVEHDESDGWLLRLDPLEREQQM